jgi:hypothetical protein
MNKPISAHAIEELISDAERRLSRLKHLAVSDQDPAAIAVMEFEIRGLRSSIALARQLEVRRNCPPTPPSARAAPATATHQSSETL